MIPFNYHHLYYFYVIAQEGSISKATKQLRLAQPTLSAQLRQFEEFLNVKLFIREKRKLILTDEGHKVLSYAKLIFDIGQELKDRMVDLSHQGRPHISIGISNFVPKTIVDLLLNFILVSDGETYIQLKKDRMDRLVRDLDDHIVDIILTDTPFEAKLSGDIRNKFIGKIPIVFCAHPRIAKRLKNFPKCLHETPLLFPTAPAQIAYALKEFFYEHHIEPKIVAELQDIEAIRRLALRGYGVAPLNLLTVKEAPSRQKLTIINAKSKKHVYEKVYLISKTRKQELPVVEHIFKNFHLDHLLSDKAEQSVKN